MKPFKPPTLVGRTISGSQKTDSRSEPPQKKRKITCTRDPDDDEMKAVVDAANILKRPTPAQKFQPPARKPLDEVQLNALPPVTEAASTPEAYFTVLWRKFTTKKNKTWDGDGVLRLVRGYATLQDLSGKELGKTAFKGALLVGSELSMSGRVVEIDSMISKEDYLAGRPFLGNVKAPTPSHAQSKTPKAVTVKPTIQHVSVTQAQKERPNPPTISTTANRTAFKTPLLNNTVQKPKPNTTVPVPRHDPSAKNALVMKRPCAVPKGKQLVDVVVDPLLTKHLREHQREGVAFLYECVMGMKDYDGLGAVLADEMGLGKTLQTITLLWTLMKQNPIYNEPPIVKKALIVCPATLIQNWRKEFRKWLSETRLGVFILDNKNKRLTDFTKGTTYNILIISYEKLRNVQEDLKKGIGIDIIIADEGHRMKTSQNKSALAIKSLNTDRRIILSGTPIQNDLAEFYQMVDFVNPGLLKKYSTFKKEFETPILKSQQPGASANDLEKGEARSEELAKITSMFVLRRTSEVISKYLPSKTEYVVFCKPTEAQRSVYRAIIGAPVVNAAFGSNSACLELISMLKKVCNSPNLLLKKSDTSEEKLKTEVLRCIPASLLKSPGSSGKLQVLDSLLHRIRTTTEEKVVLVSNYTSTMDVLANLLTAMSYKYLRLDGSTPQGKRQGIVDQFNDRPLNDSFVFLLSAKAGGIGINLIGASRLILFDLDWNPSTDLQAMARIHRDGQKKPCYIYRLVTSGVLDEKIFQRQVSKTGISDNIVDGKNITSSFTREELRDLFSLDDSHGCQTHKLLGCRCGGTGMPIAGTELDDEFERNDLALLNSGDADTLRTEDGIDVLRLDGEDIPSTSKGGVWKNAKDYDWRVEEDENQRNAKGCKDSSGKVKMLSLMEYAHFDASDAGAESSDNAIFDVVDSESDDDMPPDDPLGGVIDDDILRCVLREEGGRIVYVFSKLSN